jgi:iron complex transport system substrate-binding protein
MLLAGVGSAAVRPERGTAHRRTALMASNGIALPATATRIVSLSDAATEDLFAVGAGRHVVAVDEYSTYPPSAPRTKLDGLEPNVEAIAAYHPDLVVISDNVDNLEQHLASLKIPVLLEAAPPNFAGLYGQMLALGAASGHAGAARTLVATLKRKVSAAVASVKRESPPLKVYDELDQTFYSVTSRTFVGQIFSMLGLRNIADGAGKTGTYPQLSGEYIVASDPDLIVLSDSICCGQSYTTVAARPAWSTISAIQHHEVIAVNDTIASEWGPRIVDYVQEVAAAVRRIEAQR